ncbi:gamma-glutamyltranspeptidase/glutathione hydrolase [Barrientosiimonas humi]|uniref:Gamma-glutamyltranspeptidase/glutathione hydrolase n=1 Tax=Barrientosiimonas humi TaxID=999931 RepID=A0A542X9K1_9MICO|nr:gamma-glutamyltransferase [Barrientosiimonas humi]TQL32490.1 gamma-glutamyltranspeptidase/glutathione hydrolase [Barrientosiimonas humi]CAG7572482.1 Putative gamma-glutamyltransferase YwrD [Barrientosiimonas humi]
MTTFTTRPTLAGTFGMAASTHWSATATAMSVLERGGNAVDAACAAGFVLQVVEPHLNGPGGDAPIIVSVRGERPRVLCGQGVAPAGASAEHYRGLGLDLVPGTGPLAAAVPGAVEAWLVLLRDHGSWPLRDVLDHAIGLAERGHPFLERASGTVASVRDLFTEHWPTSAQVWLPGGAVPAPGRLFTNPALAATWQRVLREAEAAGADREAQIEAALRTWKTGFVAEAMVRTAQTPAMDSSGEPHAGTMTADDLAAPQARWEDTVDERWGDWTVHKAGAWSQGPAFLQQLQLLNDVAPQDISDFDPDLMHRLVEGTKLALADRDAWFGDAAPVDVAALLDPGYARARAGLIGEKASGEWRPGQPYGREAQLPAHVRRLLSGDVVPVRGEGAGEPTVQDHAAPRVDRVGRTAGDTCHLDVVDRWGTMVSATPSGGWLQSNPVVPELGFPLGTRLQMTWLDEGLPNTLTPGRRPRTTLSPSMASLGGVPTMAFGTPGGDQQDQWSFHLFLRVAAGHARTGELDLQGGIDAPDWHTDALIGSFWPRAYVPRSVVLEANHGPGVAAALRARGHQVSVGPAWSEGRLSAVARDPETGMLYAGANPRGMQGYAAGR